jgi:glutamyl-tRNA synthetase
LPAEEIARLEAAAAPRAIRFRVPPGETTFHDLVHGSIAFDNAVIEDFVVLRSDRQPTYHLSVVADDIDMAITHVVRGDDHISNTPKHVLLYQAFDAATPAFAHVPLILGPDKKRLSKRHGATSVMEYQRLGYLPDAMVNFLSLLGWSPGTDQELLSRDELTALFALEGISGGNAVFNPEKLDWFNQQYIARMSAADLAPLVEPWLRDAGLWTDDLQAGQRTWFHALIDLLKPRVRKLDQFVEEARPFLSVGVRFDDAAVFRHLSKRELLEPMQILRDTLATVDPFDRHQLETALRALADAKGLKAAALIHATRVAVVGRAASPGLFEVLELLGRDRVVVRMSAALPLITR